MEASAIRRTIAAGAALSVLAGVLACHGDRGRPRPRPSPRAPGAPASPSRTPLATARPDPDALPQGHDLPATRRAIQVVAGQERLVDTDAAVARGLTVVDLSDQWAPVVFGDGVAPVARLAKAGSPAEPSAGGAGPSEGSAQADGSALPNRYRAVFVGLASDRSDGDGQPLPPAAHNFLELYGIPPTLSVIGRRVLADAARSCDVVDTARLLAVDSIATWGATTEKKELGRHRLRAGRLEAARQQGSFATLDELAAARPRLVRDLVAHRRLEAERAAFAEVERRLACEGLMDPARHQPGSYDIVMRLAMLDFQQKNVLPAQADITRGTLEALAVPLQENNFQALRRTLTERAAHAGGFIEDGSVLPAVHLGRVRREPTYRTADGGRRVVPDLVGSATAALLARMGLITAADMVAFFRRHPAEDFRWLKVAVRFPDPPEYYGPQMDLFAEIDRGDVWYDFPFDPAGRRLPQPRLRFPSLTLFVRWRGERVPLCRWRTTVGGWRSELAADGQEYFRYKGSDVGPRLWRHIVAAPVWIPPASSPLGSMVKTKWVNGTVMKVVNHDETGPGYLSAYGLVAAIHVEPVLRGGQIVGYFDNQIRTHGSSDYLSLRGRFSHGCHRLSNNLAVRLFSFILQHRRARTLGSMALGFRRAFYLDGEVFEMRLPSRGFYFELDPPIPVETLRGTIKGVLARPLVGYLPRPGVVYTSSAPPPVSRDVDSKAGGNGAGEISAERPPP